MNVLVDSTVPFYLAHGGGQIQIEQTRLGLERIGVQAEFARWFDPTQKPDLIHVFGAPPKGIITQARLKGIPVVLTNLFTETCNRSNLRLKLQGIATRSLLGLPGGQGVKDQLVWRSFTNCACNVVGLEAEKYVLETVFGVPPSKIAVVPLGLPEGFLRASTGDRSEPHLVCVGTITPRKNSVPLARLAREAQAPILFVGDPYDRSEPYWKQFEALIDDRWVKYRPHVSAEAELIGVLQRARGLVIMSEYENWCLVAHEAAACGLPVLLPRQKWSIERFGDQAQYFSGPESNATILRDFYERCPSFPAPKIKLYSWTEVAQRLLAVYERVFSTSW